MKVLITGGGGMVGRSFIERAAEAQWTLDAPRRAELDLLDAAATRAYLCDSRPDIVVHCAGVVGGIRANMAAPYDFAWQNLVLGANVVAGAVGAEVPRLLNLGSSCMYPRNAPNPLTEDAILSGELEPTNEGYAVAKIATARLCDYASAQCGVEYRTLVPCNLYGPHDDFNAETAHLVPAVIRKIHAAVAAGSEVVDIWGDGTARREFMFVGDLADFMCLAIERFEELASYTNVGLGCDYTIDEYYAAAAEVIGYDGEFHHDTGKPVGMRQKQVDVTRQAELGWAPAVSLHEGIRLTYVHYRETLGT